MRLIFNGRTYSDPAEMPADVRREYEQALAQFEDANNNGTPNVLENASSKDVVTIQQSSFTNNGKAFGSDDVHIDPIETTTDVLTAIARGLLGASAIAVIVVATLIFRNMDASSASQGGRVWVVVFAIAVLAVIVERYVKFSRRS
jgi:hypothetical protein